MGFSSINHPFRGAPIYGNSIWTATALVKRRIWPHLVGFRSLATNGSAGGKREMEVGLRSLGALNWIYELSSNVIHVFLLNSLQTSSNICSIVWVWFFGILFDHWMVVRMQRWRLSSWIYMHVWGRNMGYHLKMVGFNQFVYVLGGFWK